MKRLTLPALALLAGTAIASADDWTTKPGGQGMGAFSEARDGDRVLQLGCYSNTESALAFLLLGGPGALPPVVQKNTSVMMWITLPDNRTARYPVDTEYLGAGDNALIGRLLVSNVVLDFFAKGAKLKITDVEGTTLFSTGMKGSSKARAAFRSACGL